MRACKTVNERDAFNSSVSIAHSGTRTKSIRTGQRISNHCISIGPSKSLCITVRAALESCGQNKLHRHRTDFRRRRCVGVSPSRQAAAGHSRRCRSQDSAGGPMDSGLFHWDRSLARGSIGHSALGISSNSVASSIIRRAGSSKQGGGHFVSFRIFPTA